jgi:hypothetical protein
MTGYFCTIYNGDRLIFGGSSDFRATAYDPAHFNDRLLLGLKGTMSEAELHVLRARLRGGIINKARRGELEMRLPIGFVEDKNSLITSAGFFPLGERIAHPESTLAR